MATFVNELRKLFGIDIEVRGREHLKGSEACIIVANHQTSLDFFGKLPTNRFWNILFLLLFDL